MGIIPLLVAALVGVALGGGLLFYAVHSSRAKIKSNLGNLELELQTKKDFVEKIEGIYSQMVDLGTLKELAKELSILEESLKAERGRITITQAELETVETRLRELEEIERELAASGIETQEEMKILEKKTGELNEKNEQLKAKIQKSMSELEAVLGEIELSSQAQEQITNMQTELLQTQEKIDVLLVQIEQGNEQYFILKRRYDALDIEYAQLYEKFAEFEDDDEE